MDLIVELGRKPREVRTGSGSLLLVAEQGPHRVILFNNPGFCLLSTYSVLPAGESQMSGFHEGLTVQTLNFTV